MSNRVIPDAFHVKRIDALDIAEAFVRMLSQTRRVVRLYLAPNGDVGYELGADGPGIDGMSLVGTYDRRATAREVLEDILAMQRTHIHGKAEAV